MLYLRSILPILARHLLSAIILGTLLGGPLVILLFK
ncbi:putative MnhB-related membrane protein [Rhizobium paranaense]|uniref:Putative MnhB-related membrane protein n=1 Tax=Rhizobium paranaense TaxID=1650438 RepID=A0A7W8XUZ1_9HYPH|nr:putative MnhB-related membrane protein [Rhizobium paranaense]